MEQQLKKAEAAQRRRMQNEKAARESEVHLSVKFHLFNYLNYLALQGKSKLSMLFFKTIGRGNQENTWSRFQQEEERRENKEAPGRVGTGIFCLWNLISRMCI